MYSNGSGGGGGGVRCWCLDLLVCPFLCRCVLGGVLLVGYLHRVHACKRPHSDILVRCETVVAAACAARQTTCPSHTRSAAMLLGAGAHPVPGYNPFSSTGAHPVPGQHTSSATRLPPSPPLSPPPSAPPYTFQDKATLMNAVLEWEQNRQHALAVSRRVATLASLSRKLP